MLHAHRFFRSACARCNATYATRRSPLHWQLEPASELRHHAKPDMALVDLVSNQEVMLIEGKVRNDPLSSLCAVLLC